MLHALDEIDWGALKLAHGTAESVPEKIRALASDNPSKRGSALHGLYDSIYHQGSIYEATVAAIPFLLEVALDSSNPIHPQVFYFIAHCCRPKLWLGTRTTPEAAWSHAIIEHVDMRTSDLLERIGEDPQTERGVLTCLFYAEDRSWVGEQIARTIDNVDPSNHILAAIAAHGSDPESLEKLFQIASDRSVRFASLIAKSTIGGLSKRQIHFLVEGIVDREIRDPVEEVLADIDECLGSFPELLAMSTSDAHPFLVPPLCTYMEQQEEIFAWHALLTLLGITFAEPLLPVEPSSLGPSQTLVLEAAVRSSVLWELGNTPGDIADATGINASSSEELGEFLGYREPVVALVMTPSESPIVQHRLEQIGRDDWKHVPWIVFRGDTTVLEAQIEEDETYFSEEVMGDAYQIATTIVSNIADDVAPNLTNFRFYPNLSKSQLVEVCHDNGWTVHEAPGWAADLSSISESEVIAEEFSEDFDPGLSWDDLTKRERAAIEQIVYVLDHAGWQETKNWFAFVKDNTFSTTPLAIARYFGLITLETSLWFYDRAIARKTGEQIGSPYLSLAVIGDDETTHLRLHFGNDLSECLKVLTKYQDALSASADGFPLFVRAALEAGVAVSLEFFEEGMLHALTIEGLEN